MLYAHTCAHTYKQGYTYVHMKLEEGKRPFLSLLQFDGEAEVLAFSCLASASLSVKRRAF